MKVGIVGIGGLGQMGIQLAKAMGNTVTAISTSPNKVTQRRSLSENNNQSISKPWDLDLEER